ncbi:MAG: Ig-like domain-containing protein [Cyanobium sp.]
MLDAGMRAMLPDLVAASDTGVSNSDNLTSDRTPVLTGSVRGAATQVRLFIDGRRGDLLPVTNRAWTYQVPDTAALSAGRHTFAVRPVDSSGRVGPLSRPLTVTIEGLPLAFATKPMESGTVSPAARERQMQALIRFNGSYQLTLDNPNPSVSNALFFAIDTDERVSANRATPDVTLSVSLDGEKSYEATFTGSFVGRRLRQVSAHGLALDLTFTRNASGLGPTVSVAGTVTLPGASAPVGVSGSTYDNPIPRTLWGGQTYRDEHGVPFVRIAKNGDVFYNPDKVGGTLTRVKSYTYNLDEYYFEFELGDGRQHTLIMGTAAQAGLTMNNIVYAKDNTVYSQRELSTLPNAQAPSEVAWFPRLKFTQSESSLTPGTYTTIADFSGYWRINPAQGSGAFVSIQGENLDLVPTVVGDAPAAQLYSALISVSLDGKNVSSHYFDMAEGMSFDGKTLRMPRQGISLTFAREYNPETRSLYRMTGTIRGRKVTGFSLFNNTPVEAFAGTYQDAVGTYSMTVSGDGKVFFGRVGQLSQLQNYVYVPLMYILAGPLPTSPNDAVTLVSFGHVGERGLAAIVTIDYKLPTQQTFNMFQLSSSHVFPG